LNVLWKLTNKGVEVLHEFSKEDKGKKFTFRDFRSPPLIDAKDVEVSPLHIIFNLEGLCWEGVFQN
jgi:hypothetical protein